MSPLTFHFDGRACSANDGDSIAAALAATGETTFGRRRSEVPRGTFCGMGVCYDCLVTVNGQRGQRACMTTVSDGMSVHSEHELRLAEDTVPPGPGAVQTLKTEIAVIGAGPAGLTAALRAATAGADVVVLDERGEPGGQYFKPRSEGYRGRFELDRQHRRGDSLRARTIKSGAHIKTGPKCLVCPCTG
jgi:hypothetical protein